MRSGQSFSEYVEELHRKLRDPHTIDQLDVLVHEMANIRLQVRNLANIVSALTAYQDALELLPSVVTDGQLKRRLPSSVLIDATQHLPAADGFYNIEYTVGGEAFRWTGPSKTFRFSVWIDRSKAIDLRLNAYHFGHPLNQNNVRLYVDGEMVPVRWDSERNCFANERIELDDSEQITTIEFELAALVADKPAEEHRQLGIPFLSLAIDSKRES